MPYTKRYIMSKNDHKSWRGLKSKIGYLVLTKVFWIALLAVFATGVASIASAQRGGPANVFISPVEEQAFSDRVEAIGTLFPKERVELTVNAPDRVTAVYFEDGQRVRKGQTLLSQAQREQLAAIEGAEATLKDSESVVERMRPLVEDGAVSQLMFDQAKRDFEVARSQLTTVQSRQKDRVLVAPFSGVLGFRQVSAGSYLTPGDPVATLIDDSIMQLDLAVPANFLTAIEAGLEISATSISLPNEVFKGVLVSIDNEIDPVTRSLKVRARLPNPEQRLKPGLFMSVTLFTAPRTSLAIPEEAIQPLGSKSFVFVAERTEKGITANRHEVKTGSRQDGMVEIISGLDLGDNVITEGIIGVREGALVKVQEKSLLLPSDAIAAVPSTTTSSR